MTGSQPSLFDLPAPGPEGFTYRADLIAPDEEARLADAIGTLPLQPFVFHGHLGARRVASFGWRYDHGGGGLSRGEAMPAFLLPLRERAAGFAGLAEGDLAQALVTEYPPGAGIGWHRDKPVFGEVVGVSLLADCRLRFRRRNGAGWDRMAVEAQARSAYLLRGAARTVWEHSIAPMAQRRLSITFRTLA